MTLMSFKELREELLAQLAGDLAPLGFERRAQSFRRDAGSSRHALHIAFIKHENDFDLTADVGVRLHAVENVLNAERSDLTDRERAETATVGAELGNLAGVGQRRWTVRTHADVDPAAAGVLDWFKPVGEPFLARFSSPEETLRTLDLEDRHARLICPIPDVRTRVRAILRQQLNANAVYRGR